MLKEWPEEDKPREKLLKMGPKVLSETELLAILLRTGSRDESVIDLARRVLYESGGLVKVSRTKVNELSQFKGLGPTKAATILAALELGRRLCQQDSVNRSIIRSPSDAAELVMNTLRYEEREHFKIILLSTKNHVLDIPTISVGSLNASIVHPREVFREAIRASAASMILVHNHPSGDPAPSPEDRDLTHRLVESGKLLHIAVLDHIIIGDGKYVSFKEKGIL